MSTTKTSIRRSLAIAVGLLAMLMVASVGSSTFGFSATSRREHIYALQKGETPENFAIASMLARYRPNDFGSPRLVNGTVVITARGQGAHDLIKRMNEGERVTITHSYGKTSDLSFPANDGVVRPVTDGAVLAEQNAVLQTILAIGLRPEHRDVVFKGLSINPWDGRYVVDVHRFTAAFAEALAAVVPTSEVLIVIDPDPRLPSLLQR